MDNPLAINASYGTIHQLDGSMLNSTKGYSRLSMEKAAKIHSFYMYEEKWISICKKTAQNLTFKGGISKSWGGSSPEPVLGDEAVNLKRLLVTALDWKRMFGMCPVKVVEDPLNSEVRRAVIPQFGTGTFMQRMNPNTYTSEVIYVMDKSSSIGPTGSLLSNRDTVVLPVFVWPGHEPDVKTGLFKSDMFMLYEEFCTYKEFKENALDADFNATHPTVFTQHRKDTSNPLDDFEDEYYAGEDDDGTTTEAAKRTYKRQLRRAAEIETMHDIAKIADATGNNKRAVVDPVAQDVSFKKRRRVWEGNERPIPEGEELVTHTLPKTIADLQDARQHYEEEVCLTMGIPKSYITRQSTGKGLKGHVQDDQNILRVTVEDDRRSCSMFFSFVYNLLYKARDDSIIVNSLEYLDKLENIYNGQNKQLVVHGKPVDASTDITLNEEESLHQQLREQAIGYGIETMEHVKGARNKLVTLAKKESRVDLIFEEDPFVNVFEVNEILVASDRFIFTPEEEVNLLRRRFGYPILPPNHELIKHNELLRMYKLESAKPKENADNNNRKPAEKKEKKKEKKEKKDKGGTEKK